MEESDSENEKNKNSYYKILFFFFEMIPFNCTFLIVVQVMRESPYFLASMLTGTY